jgi:fatty acid desaturase
MEAPREAPSLWRRLAWLVALWAGGVLSLGVVAWLLKLFMRAAGLAG